VTAIRRLDHVAVVVRDTDAALRHFAGHLGLGIVSTEVLETPRVRLTYLDLGNALLQLVEPLDADSAVADHLARHGEGLHHIAFGVDDVEGVANELAPDGAPPARLGSGRGRPSAFVPGVAVHGVVLETTRFHRMQDVEAVPGWLAP
jgi:methylmalonyl-CoA/ethylmalonyl-CoA epimerase